MADEIAVREHPVAFTIEVQNRTLNRRETLQVLDIAHSKLDPRFEIMAPDGYLLVGLSLHSQLEHTRADIRRWARVGDL